MTSPRDQQSAKHPTENRESNQLVRHCFDLCRELGISTILAFAESIQDQRYIAKCQDSETIILLARKVENVKEELGKEWRIVQLPEQNISRTDQFQFGLLISVLNGFVKTDETVLCLTGLVGSLRLDNLLITNLRRDNRWFRRHSFDDVPGEMLSSPEFFRIIDIALRFAKQGREGRAIGTAFIIGDTEELKPYVKQLILNPFQGHAKSKKSIHNEGFIESMRELSTLDGAFIINNMGVVERAAAYLSPPNMSKKIKIPKGYGARHTSAAALTAATKALAVVVSESSSSVVVFYDGSPILELNKK